MSKILRATVLSLMLVFLLAGCGGGDSAEQAEEATQTDAAEQVTTEQPTDEHPTAEHPTDEHPTDEHPATEHPATDTPDSTQTKADHPQ